jgi:hypothetical protein
MALRDLDNDDDMDYIKSKMPTYPEDPLGGVDGFLESTSQITPFLYDSVIALGLAACNATRPGA